MARERGLANVVLLAPSSFERVRSLARKHFGFDLERSKLALVSRRIQQLRRELGAHSAEEVVECYLQDPNEQVLAKLADYLSTNHTFFHRESEHFDEMQRRVLPELKGALAARRDLRVWCAAASTGQEPYELAMWIREILGPEIAQWKAGLLATDISSRALTIARRAIYERPEVESLPSRLRHKYTKAIGTGQVQIVQSIRKDVVFRRLNLLEEGFPFRARFHVIFCRNVMIYFDRSTRMDLIGRLIRWLEPGGYLFVGRAESARGFESDLRFIQAGMYQKHLR